MKNKKKERIGKKIVLMMSIRCFSLISLKEARQVKIILITIINLLIVE